MKNILFKYVFVILGLVALVNIPAFGLEVIDKGPIATPITIPSLVIVYYLQEVLQLM